MKVNGKDNLENFELKDKEVNSGKYLFKYSQYLNVLKTKFLTILTLFICSLISSILVKVENQDFSRLRVDDLKDELKKRGISYSRNAKKSELVELLTSQKQSENK